MNTHINEFSKTSELIDSLTNKSVKFPYVANITGRDYVNYDEIDLTQPFTIEIGDTIPYYYNTNLPMQVGLRLDDFGSTDISSVLPQLKIFVKKNDEDWVVYSGLTNPYHILFNIYWLDENGNIVDFNNPDGDGHNYKLDVNKGDKFQIKANFGIFNELFTGSTKAYIRIGCEAGSLFQQNGYFCTLKVYGNIQSLFNLDYATNFDYSNTSNFDLNQLTFYGIRIDPGSGEILPAFKNVITDYSGLIIAGDFYSIEDLFTNMQQNYQYWNVYNVESSGPNTYSNSKYEKSPIILSNIGLVTVGPNGLFDNFEEVRLYSPNLIGTNEYLLQSDNTLYIRTDAENIPSYWENNNKVIKD